MKQEVIPILMAHHFPGNIRELENILDYATVVCKNDHIGIEHLPDYLTVNAKTEETNKSINHDGIKAAERSYIYNALEKNNWNRKTTAESLGMHPTTLWRKIKQMKIDTPDQDGRSKTH